VSAKSAATPLVRRSDVLTMRARAAERVCEFAVIFQIIIDTDYTIGVIRNPAYSRSVIVKISQ